jgi:ubiquinone/menaquinone biosynthesis C-methylase UbiE
MMQKFNLEAIRNFWKEQAVEHGQSPKASWSDQCVIDLETTTILKYLEDNDRVLDVGCANGYSTVQFASQKAIAIRGLDYTPEMIEQAQLRLETMADKLVGTVSFGVDDITSLSERADTYDKVVCIRVIINLREWGRQVQGLHECARVLKPGGTFLLSEATLQGWNQLNKFRREWGLPEIPMPPFNQYLDQDHVIQVLDPHLRLVEIVNFASTYYVGTRVLKPLLIKALEAEIDVANPNMEWNRWMSKLPAWGDYGVQKLFVFKKA